MLLISTRESHQVADKLFNYPEIASAYSVYGQYNVVAMALAKNLRELIKRLREELPEIESITMLIPDRKIQQSYGGLV